MGAYFFFILKSSICISVFYLFYKALMSRDTFHCANRICLLTMIVLSFVLSVVHLPMPETPLHRPMVVIEGFMYAALDESNPTNVGLSEAELSWKTTLAGWGMFLYYTGMAYFLIRFLVGMLTLTRFFRRARRSELFAELQAEKHFHLYEHDGEEAPFSWLHRVLVARKDLEENGRTILLHEAGHVERRHSIDILLVELLIVIQWFNPAVWLIRRELQDLHEYEADEAVLAEGVDARHYQLLLIKKAVGNRLIAITNHLTPNNNLNKRITMMLKKRTSPWAMAKYAFVLPLAVVGLTAFARPEVKEIEEVVTEITPSEVLMDKAILPATSQVEVDKDVKEATPKIAQKKVTQKKTEQKKVQNEEQVFMVVEDMPEFPGGMGALSQFIATNLHFPSNDEVVAGRVIVQFVVRKDGTVDNVKIVRSIAPAYDAEAIRVVKMMPKWKPGKQRGVPVNVRFTLPISFVKQDGKTKLEPDSIFLQPEKMPEFPGGIKACMEFLSKNLVYPAKAREANIEGRVIVQFTVHEDGRTDNYSVMRGVDPLLDAEALRVLALMPRWTPAMKDGKPVSTRFTVPITFRLPKEDVKKSEGK